MHRSFLAAGVALLSTSLLGACATDAPEAPQAVERPYAGSLRVTPDPVAFSETIAGCVRTVTVQLENTGSEQAVVVSGTGGLNESLRVSGELPLTIRPRYREYLDVHFTPGAAGDWSTVLELETSDGAGVPYRLALQAIGLEPPEVEPDLDALRPLDLIFVLDVSTTMNEMANLRAGIVDLFDFIESNELDVRFGLTTFENDVVVHRDAEFLDRAAFFEEFDSQLLKDVWVPDPDRPRQLVNFDFPENILDAVYRSADEFPFRAGSRRFILLMTDDTFLEPPSVFSDGTPALWSYKQVSQRLVEQEVRVFSLHESAKGRGLSSNYKGRPSLVTLTNGVWFELAAVDEGTLTLAALLGDLVVGPTCN